MIGGLRSWENEKRKSGRRRWSLFASYTSEKSLHWVHRDGRFLIARFQSIADIARTVQKICLTKGECLKLDCKIVHITVLA